MSMSTESGTLETRELAPADVRVVRVEDEHADALAVFFHRVEWHATVSPAAVRRGRAAAAARNLAEPGADVPAFAFFVKDEVVGYIGTIPVRFWNGSEEVPGHWLKGLMVLPEHRNGPVGYLVLKEAARHIQPAGAMVVAEPARKLFSAVRCRDVGELSNQILILRPGRVLRLLDAGALPLERIARWLPAGLRWAQRTGLVHVGGAGASVVLRGWSALTRLGTRRTKVTAAPLPAAAELDGLWGSVRAGLRAAVVRNAAYLAWRYPATGDSPYRFVVAREGGALVGLGVVRQPSASGDPRLAGIRMATLSDALFPPSRPDVGVAIVREAAAAARRMGADALLCSATHPALRGALRRSGALPFPGNVHFHFRADPKGPAFPDDPDGWWLTRGDSDADGVF